jgi:hypothetical protein
MVTGVFAKTTTPFCQVGIKDLPYFMLVAVQLQAEHKG